MSSAMSTAAALSLFGAASGAELTVLLFDNAQNHTTGLSAPLEQQLRQGGWKWGKVGGGGRWGGFGTKVQGVVDALSTMEPTELVVVADAYDAQCCVTALSHARPGSMIAADGTRLSRACSSGAAGCGYVAGGEAPL
eukprot:gene52483-24283_t